MTFMSRVREWSACPDAVGGDDICHHLSVSGRSGTSKVNVRTQPTFPAIQTLIAELTSMVAPIEISRGPRSCPQARLSVMIITFVMRPCQSSLEPSTRQKYYVDAAVRTHTAFPIGASPKLKCVRRLSPRCTVCPILVSILSSQQIGLSSIPF